jgi:hypothetical protein
MISEFTRDDLRKLAARQEEPCVSIYTPLHLEMPEALHNSAPFKKLLSDAERQLNASGYGASVIAKLAQPGRDLLTDYGFWQQRSLGLVAFLSPYGFYRFRLPLSFPEKLIISNRFYTKPLLPLLHSDGRFFILAFSQNEVRFLQATRYSATRLDLKNIPANMDEALQMDTEEHETQLHTFVSAGGRSTGIFHTPVTPPDLKKENIAQYVQILAKRVSERVRSEPMPLVLAAVEYLHPMFHESCNCPSLTEPGIHGNPETLSDEQLREMAWSKLGRVFDKAREDALKRYRESRGGNLASSDPAKVVPAAQYGGVDTLFVETDQERWGRFDAASNTVELHEQMQPEDVDLLDAAAIQTLLNSGTVYALPREKMPDPSPMAALFRYPAA